MKLKHQREMAKALDDLVTAYCALIDSGDCGFWNAEQDEEIVEAKRVLALAKKLLHKGEQYNGKRKRYYVEG
jgi:hypothetical protein